MVQLNTVEDYFLTNQTIGILLAFFKFFKKNRFFFPVDISYNGDDKTAIKPAKNGSVIKIIFIVCILMKTLLKAMLN